MKRVFVHRIDGGFCRCPFVGYKIANVEEFINLVKSYYNKTTGYPGLYFSTKHSDIKLVFSGHQYEHGIEGKWSIFHNTDTKPTNWFSIKASQDWFDLFEDDEVVQNQIDAISLLVKQNNGITIKV